MTRFTAALALFLITSVAIADDAPPKPPRAARSVHLHYSLPANTQADAFYNELTGAWPEGRPFLRLGPHQGRRREKSPP